MTALGEIAGHDYHKRYTLEVKEHVLELLARGASPAEVERRYGVSRKTVATWKRRAEKVELTPCSQPKAAPVLPKAVTPLRVAVPGSIPLASNGTMPCPINGCKTTFRVDATRAELLTHYQAVHATSGEHKTSPVGKDVAQTAKLSQIRPQRFSGQRWFECDQCGGEFKYLTRGGTCNGCKERLGED